MKKKKLIIISMCLILNVFSANQVFPQDVYSSEVLFTIPWGDQAGQLSQEWLNPDYNWAPPLGPIAVSQSGGFVIVDYTESNFRLSKFDLDGSHVGTVNLDTYNMRSPNNVAVSDSGEVLVAKATKLLLLDENLQLLNSETVPLPHAHIAFILRSINGGFWCIYDLSTRYDIKRYLVEYNLDGSISSPQLLFSGQQNDQLRYNYTFISPSGTNSRNIKDMTGHEYKSKWKSSEGLVLKKKSPGGEVVFTYTLNNDANCKGLLEYSIEWNGDFYTLHATSSGEVLTKYDLHHDPVCTFDTVTQMPYSGPSPAAIEFMANAFDEDNDELTYHWDFDGDFEFDEPVDDSFTGDPWNPTHEYTSEYTGQVNLKVTDNYQGECDSTMTIVVDVT